jgi:hypothetical protein
MPRFRPVPTAIVAGLAALVAWAVATPAGAADDLGPDGALCRFQTEHQGRLGGLPDNLLTAISLVESGRHDDLREEKTAWPWTVMAEGRGRYFPTKAAAVAEVRRLQARGLRNIDVGCMQVNLFYHGDAFPDLETAFDPAANVAYAVRFLQDLRRETGSWTQAMTRYHSATPEYAHRYRSKLEAELAALADDPTATVAPLRDTARLAAQRQTVAARQQRMAAVRAEAETDRAAARAFAEQWRARKLAEYRAAKAADTGDDDAVAPADAS